MSSVTTDELLDYLICPLRYTFKAQTNNSFDNFFQIRSYIYSQLFDYCLYLKSTDDSITLHKLNEKLNYIWNSIKDNIPKNIGISNKLYIKGKLEKIALIFTKVNKVLYYNLPRSIIHNGIEILYNFYTYDEEYDIKTIVKFNNYHYSLNSDSYTIRILYNILLRDINNLNDNYKHNLYLYRCDTTDLYQSKLVADKALDIIFDSITNGIKNKIFYPKNDHLNCLTCRHNKNCDWSTTI